VLDDLSGVLREFIEEHAILVLNVAGSREGKEPGSIYEFVMETLDGVFNEQ
jgi:hypothetical protein